MNTFTLTATFPSESVLAFAQSKGWTEESGITAPDFCSDYFKQLVVRDISRLPLNQIQEQKEAEVSAASQAISSQISQAITVTVA